MATLFSYEIEPPTNVIETSTSPHPDDVSKAHIRIKVSTDSDVKQNDIDKIDFIINVPVATKADFEISGPSVNTIVGELREGVIASLLAEFPKDRKAPAPAAPVTEIAPGIKWRINSPGDTYLVHKVDGKLQISGPYGDSDILTKSPGSITPVAQAFQHWAFSRDAGGDVFVASPDVAQEPEMAEGSTPPAPGSGGAGGNDAASSPAPVEPEPVAQANMPLIFHLYDVEVVEHTGVTTIDVVEYRNGDPVVLDPPLKIRKIKPDLRIDYFQANAYAIGSDREDPVTLSWATTSAHTVELWGPDGEDMLAHVTDDGTGFGDAEIELNSPPRTTSTYTLIARGEADDINKAPVALQQLTITVMDQIKTSGKVDAGQLTSNSATVGNVSIENDKITVGNVSISNDSNTAEEVSIKNDSITANTITVKSGDLNLRTGDQSMLAVGGVENLRIIVGVIQFRPARKDRAENLSVFGSGFTAISAEIEGNVAKFRIKFDNPFSAIPVVMARNRSERRLVNAEAYSNDFVDFETEASTGTLPTHIEFIAIGSV